MLNQNLPDLDDTLRGIQHLLGLHLRHILSKACLREGVGLFGRKQFPFHCCEAFVYAQADSEQFLRGESAEGWELLARWRVWLVHWGQDELAAGDLGLDHIDETLSFKELGAEIQLTLTEAHSDLLPPEELLELALCIQSVLIDKASDLVELRWRSHSPAGSPDILDLVRCIVEEPWSEGCETLAVVYLELLIAGFWQQQVAQFAAAGDVRGAYGMPRSNRYVAVAALGIVALHALGAENCLLPLRVCRGVCTDSSVQEAARRKLEDRRAFRFLTYSGRKVVVRGFRCAWSWLTQQSHEKGRGEGLHPTSAAYFKTVGQGPEMYAVLGEHVYYNDLGKWHQYCSATVIPWDAVENLSG